ncbi:hypothetical protein V7659_01110 [Neobacillus drentensis]|uniref:hypothetical protein n=1 Tax=Neobacillus drentensis TaxID=220684 RepID=UPI002FFE9A94
MERPYIICHMLTSLDGKIVGDYLKEERAAYFRDLYKKIHDRYGYFRRKRTIGFCCRNGKTKKFIFNR